MHNIFYVLINFSILVLIVFLFGRKTIVSMFKSRREKIYAALDKTEKVEAMQIPEIDAEKLDISVETDRSGLIRIENETEEKINAIRHATESECFEIRRDMISSAKEYASVALCNEIRTLLQIEPYRSEFRKKESEMADMILKKIRLTPGDMAYLKYHDVLYVTLTSAFELDCEIVSKIRSAAESLLDTVSGKASFWVKVDPELVGGMKLRIGDTIYDCTITEELYQLKNMLNKQEAVGNETPDDIINGFLDSINRSHRGVHLYEYQLGRVMTVSDGICWMDGLADIMYCEVVEFECGERGMVLDIQHDRIGCVIYGSYEHIESGSRVRRVGRIASVPVGEKLLGRVVNPIGRALDGKGKIRSHDYRPIEFHAPSIPERSSVNRPLQTGIKAVDALIPIGRGQRELIIGDRQTGKTSIIIDTIINQKDKNVICIYVAIGQKDSSVADLRSKLEKYGAMEYTTIVCASASDSASLQYVAPFAATAMGEHFMYSGKDVLIIYDDLSKHAVAYRELSLLLHRPSGREAYPGDIFFLHSRLLERSAQLSDELGGGSMTALPVIETLAGDISSYIPTNVISITDGQIFLDSELFNEGQRPAVNVGLSVSRVGSSAQTKLMKQVSASLRMNLAQYRELLGFAQFGSDVDSQTQKTLDEGARMMAVLRQGKYTPLDDWKQALVIYAVSAGFANNIPINEIESFEALILDAFEKDYPSLVNELKKGTKMDDSLKSKLNSALAAVAGDK